MQNQAKVGREMLGKKKQHTKTDTDSARERVASNISPNTAASGCAGGVEGATPPCARRCLPASFMRLLSTRADSRTATAETLSPLR
jgi:hypothetical protein